MVSSPQASAAGTSHQWEPPRSKAAVEPAMTSASIKCTASDEPQKLPASGIHRQTKPP